MREKLTYEQKPVIGPEGASGVTDGTETDGGVAKENGGVEASKGESDVGVVKTPFKPKGTSITMMGCGRRDGSDVNNSMSLADFYALMLTGRMP